MYQLNNNGKMDLLDQVIDVALSQANIDLLVELRKCVFSTDLLAKFDNASPELSQLLGLTRTDSFNELVLLYDAKVIVNLLKQPLNEILKYLAGCGLKRAIFVCDMLLCYNEGYRGQMLYWIIKATLQAKRVVTTHIHTFLTSANHPYLAWKFAQEAALDNNILALDDLFTYMSYANVTFDKRSVLEDIHQVNKYNEAYITKYFPKIGIRVIDNIVPNVFAINTVLTYPLTRYELKYLVKAVCKGSLRYTWIEFINYNYYFHNALYYALLKDKQWSRARVLAELHPVDSNFSLPKTDLTKLLVDDTTSEDSDFTIDSTSDVEDEGYTQSSTHYLDLEEDSEYSIESLSEEEAVEGTEAIDREDDDELW